MTGPARMALPRVTRRSLLAGAAWAGAIAAIALRPATPALAATRTDAVIGMVLEPPHLDPTAGAAAAIGEVVYANVMEGLTRIGPDGSVRPALAESWEVAPDGLSIVFHLRKGATWHDGAPFSAADVKFSIDRALAPDSVNPQKALFEPIQSVEVVDPATVRLVLKRPSGTLLAFLGWPAAVIVSPKSADSNKTSPVGTGPFRFGGWAKGAGIELIANPSYDGPRPKLERLNFRIVPDATAAYAGLLAGDIDAFPVYPAPENLAQFRADPRFAVVDGQTEGKTILAINNGRKPFDDVRVRRALAYAVDRKAIIDGAMYGTAQPIGSHFSPLDPGYVDLTGLYPHDQAKAKALLAEAGVKDLKVRLVLPPTDYARRSGEIIAGQLKAVGITAEIVPVEWAQWLSDVFKARNYDLTIVSHVEPLDLDIYARDDYYFDYHSPAYKQVMAELAATVDDAQRRELYGKAQRILAEDSVNVFLFLLPKSGVWNAKLKGMWENAPIPVTDMTGAYWES